jgi:hypothetical protein
MADLREEYQPGEAGIVEHQNGGNFVDNGEDIEGFQSNAAREGHQADVKKLDIPGDQDPNILGRLIKHQINNVRTYSAVQIGNLVFSCAISGASLILYFQRTSDFVDGLQDPLGVHLSESDKLFLKGILEASVLTANWGVSALAASGTFDSFVPSLPPKLAEEMGNKHGFLKEAVYVGGFGSLAILAAAPYALATEGITFQIIVGIANTIMNYYALKCVFLKHATTVMNKVHPSVKERAFRALVASFDALVRAIVSDCIKNKQIPEALKPKQPTTELDYLKQLAIYARNQNIKIQDPMSKKVGLLYVSLGALGAGASILGLIGYLLHAHTDIMRDLATIQDDQSWVMNNSTLSGNGTITHETIRSNEAIGSLLTAGVSVPFMYLSGTFGFQALAKIVALLTGNLDKSVAMQLHPKKTMALIMTMAVLCAGSFATSVQLILTSPYFQEGGALHPLKDVFIVLAGIAAVLFNEVANIKLADEVMSTLALYMGTDNERGLAKFGVAMERALENVAGRMSRTVFAEALEALRTQDPALANRLVPFEDVETDLESQLALANDKIPVGRPRSIRSLMSDERVKQALDNAKKDNYRNQPEVATKPTEARAKWALERLEIDEAALQRLVPAGDENDQGNPFTRFMAAVEPGVRGLISWCSFCTPKRKDYDPILELPGDEVRNDRQADLYLALVRMSLLSQGHMSTLGHISH